MITIEFWVSGITGGFVSEFNAAGLTLAITSCEFFGNISSANGLGAVVGKITSGTATIDEFS